MTKLLPKNQLIILFVYQVDLLIGDHFFDPGVDVGAGCHGLFDVGGELFADLLANFFSRNGLGRISRISNNTLETCMSFFK